MLRSWIFVAGCLLSGLPSAAQERPERIYVNGKIWTGEDSPREAEALAVKGAHLLAVGSNEQIRKLAGPETSVIDLYGNRVVPGFNDAHWHFASRKQADLAGAGSLEEIQNRLLRFARENPQISWVTGHGWGYTDFPDRKPDKKYVDSVLSDRPVFLWERDGHMGVANSKALEIAGIHKGTPDPPLGRIERDANGEPTGELKEAAMELVTVKMPPASLEENYAALKSQMEEAASYGLTSLQEASAGLSESEMAAFERALAEDGVKVRFYVSIPLLKHATAAQINGFKNLRDTYRGPLLKFGSAKGLLDGTIDAKTALMFEPYIGGGNGIPMWTPEELNSAVTLYDREGFQIWLHAIGDKAIHMALDAYENAARQNGTKGRRHRVEHAEVPALDDFPRFRKLGVIASTQALFASPDATVLENFAVLLGPERAAHADSFKLYDDAGAVQAFGSDHPVFSMEVLRAIYCAVTRMTPEGTPAGGWYPQGRITVEAALRHFTKDAAYASFEEKEKGTLAPGKLADFVVLSEDILYLAPEKILSTKILLTVMGGRESYRVE